MRTNGFSNPSFENNAASVAGAGVTVASVASARTSLGTRVLYITGDSAPTVNALVYQTTALGRVTPGQWWGASLGLRASGGGALVAQLAIEWRDAANVALPGQRGPWFTLPTSGNIGDPGTMFALALQAPAGASAGRLVVRFAKTAPLGSTGNATTPADPGFVVLSDGWIDGVGATEAEVRAALAPYFDGDTPNTPDWTYSWTGTPHASTSTMVPTPGLRVERLPDAGAPQAGITVTGLAPSSESVISVQVSWDDGRTWHGVRGAERVTVTGGDFFRDHVPPLNVLARYRLVVHAGGVTPLRLEDTITIASDSAWIQDPLNPRGAVEVECVRTGAGLMLMTGTAARILRRQAVDLTTVEGARYPVASIGVRQAPSGVPLALRAVAASQGALIREMRDLLDASGQVVVRGLPLDIPLDPVAHVVTGDVEEVPVVGGLLGFRNDWQLDVTQVRPTSMRIVIPWWTYDQVQALWAPRTYDQVEAARPGATYLDWSRDPEVP